MLKNWFKNSNLEKPSFYLSVKLIPFANNEMANYCRNQSSLLKEDALEFIFIRNKFVGIDIFSENSRKQFLEEWLKKDGSRLSVQKLRRSLIMIFLQ